MTPFGDCQESAFAHADQSAESTQFLATWSVTDRATRLRIRDAVANRRHCPALDSNNPSGLLQFAIHHKTLLCPKPSSCATSLHLDHPMAFLKRERERLALDWQ